MTDSQAVENTVLQELHTAKAWIVTGIHSWLEAGKALQSAKKQHYATSGKNGWAKLVESEVGISVQHADDLIQLYVQFGKYSEAMLQNFIPSAMKLLSAPSVSQTVRNEAVERAESGEKITIAKAKEMIAQAKEAVRQEVEEAAKREVAALRGEALAERSGQDRVIQELQRELEEKAQPVQQEIDARVAQAVEEEKKRLAEETQRMREEDGRRVQATVDSYEEMRKQAYGKAYISARNMFDNLVKQMVELSRLFDIVMQPEMNNRVNLTDDVQLVSVIAHTKVLRDRCDQFIEHVRYGKLEEVVFTAPVVEADSE